MIHRKIQRKLRRIWLKQGYQNEVNSNYYEIKIETIRDIIPFLYWSQGKEQLRMYLPTKYLVMQGAFAYDEGWHPFVEALHYGPDVLTWYYAVHQPRNLSEMYFLDQFNLMGAELPPREIPWFQRFNRRPPSGEHGLSIDHGVSMFGPASKEKVKLEYKRLKGTLDKIEKNGYQPNLFGEVRGFFMRYEQNFRFFVRSGKHRSAVLSFLGFKHIPVNFHPGLPRCVDFSKYKEWPLVFFGKLDPYLAITIFKRYFEFSGREQFVRLCQTKLPYPFDIKKDQ